MNIMKLMYSLHFILWKTGSKLFFIKATKMKKSGKNAIKITIYVMPKMAFVVLYKSNKRVVTDH